MVICKVSVVRVSHALRNGHSESVCAKGAVMPLFTLLLGGRRESNSDLSPARRTNEGAQRNCHADAGRRLRQSSHQWKNHFSSLAMTVECRWARSQIDPQANIVRFAPSASNDDDDDSP